MDIVYCFMALCSFILGVKMSKKIVLTYGTFDMFYIDHLKLMERLSSLGDRLIIAVSTDEFNEI